MNNQPVDQDSNDEIKLPKVEDVFASVPVFSLILYIGIIICWFIDLFPETPFFANVYEKTIQEYQVWRLFTSIFYSSSLIMSIIIIMNCTTFLHQLVHHYINSRSIDYRQWSCSLNFSLEMFSYR